MHRYNIYRRNRHTQDHLEINNLIGNSLENK